MLQFLLTHDQVSSLPVTSEAHLYVGCTYTTNGFAVVSTSPHRYVIGARLSGAQLQAQTC